VQPNEKKREITTGVHPECVFSCERAGCAARQIERRCAPDSRVSKSRRQKQKRGPSPERAVRFMILVKSRLVRTPNQIEARRSGFDLERRSDGVSERRRLLSKRKRRCERYEVRDDDGRSGGT
jgi:hypothetical protein